VHKYADHKSQAMVESPLRGQLKRTDTLLFLLYRCMESRVGHISEICEAKMPSERPITLSASYSTFFRASEVLVSASDLSSTSYWQVGWTLQMMGSNAVSDLPFCFVSTPTSSSN